MIAFSGIPAEPALPNSAPPHRADMKSNSFAISVVSTLPAFTPTHSVLGDKREHAQRLQIEMKRVHHVMGPGKAVPAHAVSAAA